MSELRKHYNTVLFAVVMAGLSAAVLLGWEPSPGHAMLWTIAAVVLGVMALS